MSLPKKLVTVTPMSLTLATLLTIAVILLLFVSYLELSEPEHTRLFVRNKPSPTSMPASIYENGYGTFKDKCPTYGFIKQGMVQDDGSILNKLDAEITNIVKGGWALSTPKEHTMLTPDQNTVYPGKKTFQIGDCITITYLIEKTGKSVVTQVTAQ
jgi:hypothetical protein